MKSVLKKVADLATYLDKSGHREEAHQLDHMLMSLAQAKTLEIGGKVYTDAGSAWRAYSGKNYNEFVRALISATGATPGDLRTSDDIKAALVAYFNGPQVQQQQHPGATVEEGREKPAGDNLKWWNPKHWDDYAQRYIQQKRKEAPIAGESGVPGLGGANSRGMFSEE